MSDHEVVSDDDVQSFSTVSSFRGSSVVPSDNDVVSKKKRELYREFDSPNIWSFDSTKDTTEYWDDAKTIASSDEHDGSDEENHYDEKNNNNDSDQENCYDEQDNYDGPEKDQYEESDDDESVEPESAVLKQLLTECQDYFNEEMQKAEQALYQRMINGMKSIPTKKPAEKKVRTCRCEQLRAELEKLRLELEESKENMVPSLSFSVSDISLVPKIKQEMTVTNDSDKNLAVRLYVTHELYGFMRIDPSEFQIKSGETRTIQVEYQGGKAGKRLNSTIPPSLSFKWTRVPPGVSEEQRCPLQWMNDFPIRQHYINLYVSD